MTKTRTTTKTKINHYFGMLVLVTALAMAASLLLAQAQEPAFAATTFTVNSTADNPDASGADAICDVSPSVSGPQCTLRAAIEQANFTEGPNLIDFGISGTGVKTIQPSSALPTITEQTTIDGYTQTGASPNTKAVGNDASLKIVLDGSNAPQGTNGLKSVASNFVVRGLVINRFPSTGIFVFGPTVNTRIEGNFVGTDPTGTIDRGNGSGGVDIEGDGVSQAVVGGTTPASRNLISGNARDGLFMGGSFSGRQADSMRVQGNYVGTDRSGTRDLGNDGIGIAIAAASNMTVGGTTAASRNVVSGNGGVGVDLVVASGTKILGNRIGTTASGTGALGNADCGVLLEGQSSNNQIGDGTAAGSNTIAFNQVDGILLDGGGTGNRISRNSIFSNAALGIELFAPLQNAPVLTSAKTVSGKTTIKGTLAATPGQTFTIEFFSNPSGTDEGKKFIGKKSLTTDASGNASFAFVPATAVSVGQTVTATATSDATHDTSEFSAPRKVTSS